MKAYTDLEQSRKLAKILSLESADMHYSKDFDGSWFVDLAEYTSVKIPKYVGDIKEHLLPCWSLAALISILPCGCLTMHIQKKYRVIYNPNTITEGDYDNPVDACVEMIIKLHELKML